MLQLSNLVGPAGGRKNRKRIGRGIGSGTGKTSGRGENGQKSRSGGSPHPWFEGGQMPLYRRVPKRGFHNIFAKKYAILNVSSLNHFAEGTTVTPELARKEGLFKKLQDGLRILGQGALEKKLTVRAHHFSESARKKIEEAGGTVEVLS